MLVFLIILHVLICICLVLVVLVQTGKGGLDSNFGGIATNALGTQGASEFIKLWTKIFFAAFIVSCLLLAAQVKRQEGRGGRSGSILTDEAQSEVQSTMPIDLPLTTDEVEQ